jgi:hypothetical protein
VPACKRPTLLVGALLAGWIAASAHAAPLDRESPLYPVYKDAERFDAPPAFLTRFPRPACCRGRIATGSPGYVGSVRGLGRPSYYGLWSAPGYGTLDVPPE